MRTSPRDNQTNNMKTAILKTDGYRALVEVNNQIIGYLVLEEIKSDEKHFDMPLVLFAPSSIKEIKTGHVFFSKRKTNNDIGFDKLRSDVFKKAKKPITIDPKLIKCDWRSFCVINNEGKEIGQSKKYQKNN